MVTVTGSTTLLSVDVMAVIVIVIVRTVIVPLMVTLDASLITPHGSGMVSVTISGGGRATTKATTLLSVNMKGVIVRNQQ